MSGLEHPQNNRERHISKQNKPEVISDSLSKIVDAGIEVAKTLKNLPEKTRQTLNKIEKNLETEKKEKADKICQDLIKAGIFGKEFKEMERNFGSKVKTAIKNREYNRAELIDASETKDITGNDGKVYHIEMFASYDSPEPDSMIEEVKRITVVENHEKKIKIEAWKYSPNQKKVKIVKSAKIIVYPYNQGYSDLVDIAHIPDLKALKDYKTNTPYYNANPEEKTIIIARDYNPERIETEKKDYREAMKKPNISKVLEILYR